MKNKKKFEWNRDNIIALVGIVFFLVLAISIRFTDRSEGGWETTPTPTGSPSPETPEVIELSSNYHFTYKVDAFSKKEVLDGDVFSSKAKFSILGEGKEEYAKLSNSYMKLVDGTYQVLDNPLVRDYFIYLDLEKIEKVMSVSILSNNDEDDVYIYDVATPDLLDIYKNLDYDSFQEFLPNKLEVSYTKKGYFKKIEMDYSNYFTYLNKKETTFKVTMEFDEYGKIVDFDI